MSLEVRSYFSLYDKGAELSKIYERRGARALFIVPARLDREEALELITGGAPSFGARPAVLTAGELLTALQRATGTFERIIDPPDHKLILRRIVADFLTEAEAGGAALEPGYYHGGFVSVLGENIKDLLAEEVSPEALRAAIEEGAEENSPEAALASLYERYLDYLEEYGLADAAQIFTLARRKLLTDEGRCFVEGLTLVFIGFLSFTSAQLRLVRALGELADVVMFQPETGLDFFHDGIKQLGTEYSARPSWNVPALLLEAANPQLELEATARELALWACGEGALEALGEFCGYGDIGMSVGPERLHVAEYALARYKIPYNVQEGGTAADTLLGGLPSLIWRARGSGWGNYETSLLLSSPLLFGDGAKLPEYDESSVPEGLDAWISVLSRAAGETLRRAERLCRFFDDGAAPAGILSAWLAFLKESRVAERAASAASSDWALDGRVKEVASALDELEKKIKKLTDDSHEIGPASEIILKGAEAVSFINEWGATATLPVQLPQSRSLTVYAGIPPTLASHRVWVMTGVDYARWPGVMRESMLLGDDKKIKFNAAAPEDGEASHLPELSEEREQKEAVFRRVLATGREAVVMTRALFSESGDELGESPFAARLFEDEGPRRWRLAGRALYDAERAMPDGGGPWFPQAEVICSPKAHGAEEPRIIGRASSQELPRIRVSDIDRWNACPYMYWCERRLSLELPRKGLYDSRQAGVLLHRVWEEAFRAKEEKQNLSLHRYVMDNWSHFKSAAYPALDADPRLARYEKRLCRQIFDMAAEQDKLEERLARFPKIKTESERLLDGFELGGAIFTGRADRIDWFEEGAVVLDYKLGRSKNHESELQIAAYSLMLNHQLEEDILGFGWLGHTSPSLSGYFNGEYFTAYAFGGTAKKKATTKDRIDEAAEVMERMAVSVRSGEYEPRYDVKSITCRTCPFFTLCRKREGRAYIESIIEEAAGDDGE